MKVLLVGEYAWPWYQEACARALESLGCQVIRFGWLDRFKKWLPGKSEPVYRTFAHRVQYRLLLGPIPWRINAELIRMAATEHPDIIWFYNVQLITATTVQRLKKILPKAILCQYVNDNPFSPNARASMWRHFKRSIPYFNLHFTYRQSNINEFIKAGARQVNLLRSYFIPEDDFPLKPDQIEPKYLCDVVFAGHFEDDGRIEALEAICRAGFKLNLFGGGWDAALSKLSMDSPLRDKFPISPAVGTDYRQALCGAKVALCFLSTLNHDTYTRRSFQIPAMKVAMLSQRTGDLASLFVEANEAVFFSSTAELLSKLKWLLSDDVARYQIAEAGFQRVYLDGHDVTSRIRQWLNTVQVYRENRKEFPLNDKALTIK